MSAEVIFFKVITLLRHWVKCLSVIILPSWCRVFLTPGSTIFKRNTACYKL